MLNIINEWLQKPLNRYQDGVAIFKALASTEIKARYLPFFEEEKGEPKSQFDSHFTMLIDKVAAIRNKIRLNPELAVNVKLAFIQSDNAEDIEQQALLIKDLKEQIESLETDIDFLEQDFEANKDELQTKTEEVEELESKLAELGAEFQKMQERRAVKIVHYNDLPPEIQQLYDRLKEIVPLMASLHSELTPKMNHMKRKSIVNKLVNLDDEHRSIWDKIDEFTKGREVNLEEKRPEYSQDELVRGAQLAKRQAQLKENIARAEVSLNSSDRESIKANAQKRIEEYTAELDEINKLISASPEDGEDVKGNE